MKHRFAKILSAMLALMVLAMPFAALAESDVESSATNLTITLSDLTYSINDITTGSAFSGSLGTDLQLDLTCDESGILGDAKILNNGEALLAGGVSFDYATLNLVAGLNGMTDAVLVPVGSLAEQMMASMQTEDGEPVDMSALEGVTNALMALASAAENMDSAQLTDIVNTFLNSHIQYVGEVEEAGTEDDLLPAGTYQQYVISLTVQDSAALLADLFDAVKADENMLAALQDLVDAIAALLDAESGSVADLDLHTMMDDMGDTNVVAYLEINPDTSAMAVEVLSYADAEQTELTADVVVYSIPSEEDSTVIVILAIDTGDEDTSTSIYFEATVPTDGTPAFEYFYAINTDTDYMTQSVTCYYTADMTDGINVNTTVSQTTTYTFSEDDEPYVMNTTVTSSFTGDVVDTDEAAGVAGTFSINANVMDTTFEGSANMSVLSTPESTVDFDMPINLIDITQADEDTMNALMEEFYEAIQTSAARIMQLPGIQSLIGTFAASPADAA